MEMSSGGISTGSLPDLRFKVLTFIIVASTLIIGTFICFHQRLLTVNVLIYY